MHEYLNEYEGKNVIITGSVPNVVEKGIRERINRRK